MDGTNVASNMVMAPAFALCAAYSVQMLSNPEQQMCTSRTRVCHQQEKYLAAAIMRGLEMYLWSLPEYNRFTNIEMRIYLSANEQGAG